MTAVSRTRLVSSASKFATALSSSPPAVPAATALLGYNMQGSFTSLAGLAAAKAGGATLVRFQQSWSAVESYTSPGTFALDAGTEAALAYCGANGLRPIAVCGYGPPYKAVLTLTVTAPVPAGAKVVPVRGAVASLAPATDHVIRGNVQITATGKWGYYGALIHSFDAATGTITLAAPTTVALAAGDLLTVNRLLYAAPADQSPTNPSMLAYFSYLKFVASRIAANGASGYVSIWNEPPWAHDPWDARGKFYDTPPAGMNTDSRLKMFLQKALTLTDLPAGVRIINGASDKSSGSGLIAQGLAPTSAQVAASIAAESAHPYGNTPETHLFDRSFVVSKTYAALNPTTDAASNFRNLSYQEDQAGTGLKVIATECGTDQLDDTKQAVYLLRRVAASWGCGIAPVIYSLSDSAAQGFNVAAPGTFAPRTAYTALARLLTAASALGGPGGQPSDLPTLVTYSGQTWPLLSVGVYGASKSLLLVWQRSGYNSPARWRDLHDPAPTSAIYQLPVGKSLISAVDLLTGSNVAATVNAGALTVPITHTVTAITLG